MIVNHFSFENQAFAIIRLDKIDSFYGGNKIFKLESHINSAKLSGKKSLLSFGGAFSNHLVALAAIGKKTGIPTIGIVRGDELNANSNASLKFCADNGMQLEFYSRDRYRELKNITDQKYFIEKWGDVYIIPEGGTTDEAAINCAKIHQYIPSEIKTILCAVGSGGTFCGLAYGLKPDQKLIGVCASKDFSLQDKTNLFLEKYNLKKKNTQLNFEFSFGGFGKWDESLMQFIKRFGEQYKIGIDPVYTGKLAYAAFQLAANKKLEGPVALIHSGGMQAFPELIID